MSDEKYIQIRIEGEFVPQEELKRLRKIEDWAIKTRSAIQQHVEAGGTNDWLQLAVKKLDGIMEKKHDQEA